MANYRVQNPVTDEVLETFDQATDEDIQTILADTQKAYETWSTETVEHRADLVDHAVRAHAADGPAHPGLVLRPVVDHPPLGGVGHRDTQQGGAAREVRDDQAGALLLGLMLGLVLFGVGGFVHGLKVPPQPRISHVCGYWPAEVRDVVE